MNERQEFIQELTDELLKVISSRSAEQDPLDNTANGEPELGALCGQLMRILSANNQNVVGVPERAQAVRELYGPVEALYAQVITKDGPPTFSFPPYTAMLVGELRCLVRMMAMEIEALPPPWSHPNSPGYKAYYGRVMEPADL